VLPTPFQFDPSRYDESQVFLHHVQHDFFARTFNDFIVIENPLFIKRPVQNLGYGFSPFIIFGKPFSYLFHLPIGLVLQAKCLTNYFIRYFRCVQEHCDPTFQPFFFEVDYEGVSRCYDSHTVGVDVLITGLENIGDLGILVPPILIYLVPGNE